MVGIISDRTKNIDRTLRQLATDYKRTNIKSVREGESQGSAHSASEPQKGSGVLWGDPKNMSTAIGKARAAKPVAGEAVGINPNQVGKLDGPRISSFKKDHENLKIQK